MKLCLSSCTFLEDPVPVVLQKARAMGCTAVEPMMWYGHPVHGDVRKLRANELRALYAEYGMAIAAMHLGAIGKGTAEQARDSVDYLRRAVALAAEAGCGILVMQTQGPEDGPPNAFLSALREVSGDLAATGVRIAVENHMNCFPETLEDYDRLFREAPSPNIGATLDTGHFRGAGIDSAEAARHIGAKAFHAHIKDIEGLSGDPVGNREQDRNNNLGMIEVLRAQGYSGYLSQKGR